MNYCALRAMIGNYEKDNAMSMKRKPYPLWVCSNCGEKYGRRIPTCATWHVDKCGVCGKETMVTQPRDFGHLNFEVK